MDIEKKAWDKHKKQQCWLEGRKAVTVQENIKLTKKQEKNQ